MPVAVVVDRVALGELISSPDGAVAKDLTRRIIRVTNAAKQRCPVDKGRLRSSITYQIVVEGGNLVARCGSNVSYAKYQEEGTGVYGPHKTPIVPTRAKVLVFTPRGSKYPVFAASVKGVKGRHFLRDALPAAAG